nr:hypothetical protein [Gemmatimonadales bacterium]
MSTGISASNAQADANQLRANTGTIELIWNDIYDAINRVNIIIEKVPPLTDLEEEEKNQI